MQACVGLEAAGRGLVATILLLGTILWVEIGVSLEQVWPSMLNWFFVGIEGM